MRLAAAEDNLNQLPPANTIIYTDDSAKESVSDGLIRTGYLPSRRASRLSNCCSFRAELLALKTALDYLVDAHLGSRRGNPHLHGFSICSGDPP